MYHVTPKEREVLQLLAVGMSSKQIAGKMAISFHTVESHRKSLRVKFGARNVAEVITKAYQLIPLQPGLILGPACCFGSIWDSQSS